MIPLSPRRAARDAVAASPARPATATLLDTPDVRLLVFRIGEGQSVAPHRNASTVLLTVLQGDGILSGGDGERPCAEGDVVAYAPNELHGMRATRGELHLLAAITPRPGERAAPTTEPR